MDAPPKSKVFDPRPVPGGSMHDPGRMGDQALREMHTALWREKEEPHEGFSPVPIVLIFLFSALVIWCSLYIANHSGGFHSDIFDDHWRPGHDVAPVAAVDPMKKGAQLFKMNCFTCHGAEGKGQPGTYPPLAGSPWVNGNPDRPIRILLGGMTGTVEIEGNTYSGAMPALGQTVPLKDSDIAYILTFIRQSWGNNSPPVDEGRVAELRAEIGKRSPYTPQEILALHPLEPHTPPAP